jgi:hypothetical protein
MSKLQSFLIILVATTLFHSCDDQTSISGGGQVKARLTITPALVADGNTINNEDVGYIQIAGSSSMYSDLAHLSVIETDYVSVTKGQNVTVYLGVYPTQSATCRSVQVELFHNGTVVRTENYTMGYSAYVDAIYNTTCLNGDQQSFTWIVP